MIKFVSFDHKTCFIIIFKQVNKIFWNMLKVLHLYLG